MGKNQDHPTSILLVEGNDDFHVIHALCKLHNIDVRNLENPDGGKFSIRDSGGYNKLIETIPTRFKGSDISKIGVIVDADTDLIRRWTAIKNIIFELGFNPPEILPEKGLIISNGEIKFGAWIMPDNNLNGMLEDFIKFLVPDEDKLMPVVDSTLTKIEKIKLNKYSLIHKPKATLHTWLSWQEDPGTPLGQAITKRYLTTDNETCQKFIQWLKLLFTE